MSRLWLLNELEQCLNGAGGAIAATYQFEQPSLVMEPREGFFAAAELPFVSNSSSSGRTLFYPDGSCEIVIKFGSDSLDIVVVFLHEISHCVIRPVVDAAGRFMAHTTSFYRFAGRLYREFDVPLSYVVYREGRYKPSSVPIITAAYAEL